MSFLLTYEAIAKRIDHSLLSPTLGGAELEDGCRLAARYGVASVCIKPYAVSLAARVLKGSGVAVGTTVGFPHGGHAIAGEWDAVTGDIDAVTRAAHDGGAIVKVIFENCYLNDEQKFRLCRLCGELRADYVKTSTGYGTGGATFEDLRLMRRAAPAHVKLKAAGGLRTLDALIEAAQLGCDRIGASRTAEILEELQARLRCP
jgi:deoxyribose-phosphate aldolase